MPCKEKEAVPVDEIRPLCLIHEDICSNETTKLWRLQEHLDTISYSITKFQKLVEIFEKRKLKEN